MATLSDKSSEVVLLADDSEDAIVIFKRAYKEAGIPNPLRVVRDGDETIAYLNGDAKFSDRAAYPFPTLLLLDLNMPGKSGFDVLKWVRREPNAKDLRVIVTTGPEELHAANRAYKLGAKSFVVKSLAIHEFVAQLREVRKNWL